MTRRVTIALFAWLGCFLAGAATFGDAAHAKRKRTPSALEQALAPAIQKLAVERLAMPEADVRVGRVEIATPVPAGATLTSIDWSSRGRPLGWVTVRARFSPRGDRGEPIEAWVKAEIEAWVPTLVAARPLPRGAVIGEGDVRVEPRPLNDERLGAFEPARGAKLRRALETGEMVALHAIDRPVLVKRGATVAAVVSGERFQLTAHGEALEDGALGDEIALRMAFGEKKVVRGVVTDGNRVEVR